MNEQQRKAMELALEALERIAYFKLQPDTIQNLTDHYITAIKEALAQPEPSPEWMTEEEQTAYTFGWFKALESRRMAQPAAVVEPHIAEQHKQEPVAFVVKQYVGHGRPSIKGNGFDGLEIGYTREEADEFIAWVNAYINTPPQRKPLTDEIKKQCPYTAYPSQQAAFMEGWLKAEAAHGIKE